MLHINTNPSSLPSRESFALGAVCRSFGLISGVAIGAARPCCAKVRVGRTACSGRKMAMLLAAAFSFARRRTSRRRPCPRRRPRGTLRGSRLSAQHPPPRLSRVCAHFASASATSRSLNAQSSRCSVRLVACFLHGATSRACGWKYRPRRFRVEIAALSAARKSCVSAPSSVRHMKSLRILSTISANIRTSSFSRPNWSKTRSHRFVSTAPAVTIADARVAVQGVSADSAARGGFAARSASCSRALTVAGVDEHLGVSGQPARRLLREEHLRELGHAIMHLRQPEPLHGV